MPTQADKTNAPVEPQVSVVDEGVFHTVINARSQGLLALASNLHRQPLDQRCLTRPLLGELLSQSAQVEELLDAYGARGNQTWHPFRHLVATGKAFADAGYKLLHLQHSHKSYHLLPVEGDFAADTDSATMFVTDVLMNLAGMLVEMAKALSLDIPPEENTEHCFDEQLPEGRLKRNRTCRHVDSAEETVVHLATAFLNLAAESDILHTPRRVASDGYSSAIPDPLNEPELRQLEEKFHNLQSLYDTFVLDTDTEDLDNRLPSLRGHISIIYHLLEVGTDFIHHYERHMMDTARTSETAAIIRPIVSQAALLRVLMEYTLTYSSRYLSSARSLCQTMLKHYAEFGCVEVPVPRYRGFHVRPSTLVSKIAHHYGTEVKMEFGDECYDASAPLDLFRANEAINARKRRKIAQLIANHSLDVPSGLADSMIDAVRQVVTTLAAKGVLVIYERPLPLEELRPRDGEPLTQFAVDEIARLLAIGKIDIESDFTVRFIGDKRVLEDIRLLAESGYGEDNFGNNIPLPKQLRYLRK